MADKKPARADRLKSLSMPKKSAPMQEADLDLEMLSPQQDIESMGGDDIQPGGDMLGPDGEMAAAPDMLAGLEQLSDDELLGELKKRGLMSKSSPVGKAAESDLVDEGMADEDEDEEIGSMPMPKKSKPKY